MRTRSLLSQHQREALIEHFELGMGSAAAATTLQASRNGVRRFYRQWKLHGRLCLVEYPSKRVYPFELKKEVVERFLAGASKMELAIEFRLGSEQLVRVWANQWHEGGDEALRPHTKGRPKGIANPTPVTEEDRLRRQVARLEAENAYLKKLRDLRDQGLR